MKTLAAEFSPERSSPPPDIFPEHTISVQAGLSQALCEALQNLTADLSQQLWNALSEAGRAEGAGRGILSR